jgi:hypothetical protein
MKHLELAVIPLAPPEEPHQLRFRAPSRQWAQTSTCPETGRPLFASFPWTRAAMADVQRNGGYFVPGFHDLAGY